MEFNTVDGFQGREVDILILSTVRASDPSSKTSAMKSSSIGFVADVRRMNVALTRARLSLWIIGNAVTSSAGKEFSEKSGSGGKLKGTIESSENDVNQMKMGVSLPSTKGSHQKREENDEGKVSTADRPKDLISTRKRQRDAVDALLSSALISSKKPETTSKFGPVKRPLSPTTARGSLKPPKPMKASSTSSATCLDRAPLPTRLKKNKSPKTALRAP